MPIERLRVRDLSPQERADLESALADPGRFRPEDRKTFVLGLIASAWILFLAEVAIMLECKRCPWEFGDALQLFEGFFSSLPWSLRFLWHPEVFPFVASNVVLAAMLAALAMRGAESVHDALEVFDAAGERLVVAGAAQWKPLIEERRPPARSSDTPAKR